MKIQLSPHEAILELFPYFYKSTPFINENDDAIYSWCVEKYGDIPIENSDEGQWCTTFRGFFFKEERDYIMCLLRWA